MDQFSGNVYDLNQGHVSPLASFTGRWDNASTERLELQGYSNLNASSFSQLGMSVMQQHSQHRPSDPLEYLPFNQLAQRGRNAPLHALTKTEDHLPWNGQVGADFQKHQSFGFPTWQGDQNHRGPKTEPIFHQEYHAVYKASPGGSEVADSAYESMQHSSGPGDQYSDNKQELEQDFRTDFLNPFKPEGRNEHLLEPPKPPQSVKSESHLVPPHSHTRRRQHIGPCPFPGCSRQPKNLSDAKKHELTHTKPFRCTEPDCVRQKGFATDNDLQRHRKSVHNLKPTVGSTAGYICAACTGSDSNGTRKFWPRRDNFKAHTKRKHPNVDELRLIEVSKQTMRPDDARTVDEENNTVRSAMRSARQSQVDPAEDRGYLLSPSLSRNQSDQGEYGIFPDSAIDLQQDAFAGMGEHATEMNGSYPQFALTASDPATGNDLDVLSTNRMHYPHGIQVFKKSKLDHDTSTSTYQHAPIPTFQFTDASQGSTSSNTQSTSTSLQSEYRCPEPGCHKTKRRECDLKKHMKRHTRPYGCTFPSCHKKFGSRNDWKRHESSQHFLQEMWKCERPLASNPAQICTHRPFPHVEHLKRHLRSPCHNVTSALEIDSECRKYRLGREGHDRFWCGFCKYLVPQERRLSQNAWDARFKHIGDHFDKEGFEIGNWVCVEENKPKKVLQALAAGAGVGQEKRKRGMGTGKEEEEADLPVFEVGFEDGGDMFGDGGLKRKFEELGDDGEGESDDGYVV